MKELDEFEKLIASGAAALGEGNSDGDAETTGLQANRSSRLEEGGSPRPSRLTSRACAASPGRGEQAPRGDDLCPEQG